MPAVSNAIHDMDRYAGQPGPGGLSGNAGARGQAAMDGLPGVPDAYAADTGQLFSTRPAQGSQSGQAEAAGESLQADGGLHLPGYAREADTVLAARGRGVWLRLLPWLVLAAMAVFLVLSLARCSSSDEGRVHVGELAPSAARTDKVSASTSPAYQEQLARYSAARAEAALASGDSFVSPAADVRARPVPVPVPAPAPQARPARVVERPQARVPPAPAPEKPQPPSRPGQAGQGRTAGQGAQPDPAAAKMTAWLAALTPREPAPQLTMILNAPAPVQPARSVQPAAPASGLPGLTVGDILHAVNRVTLDSDAPGPAMVEVVRGPYRGARVTGSFQRLGEHLVLRFSELAARDGTLYPIEGYAIDPATDRTAVRTSVDRHTLERWGGLVAASFLEGFGDAVSRSGTSSYATVYGSGWSVPRYSLGDEMWIAAGKVGERAANVLDRGFNRAPTVVLESGTAMGVLLLRVPEAGKERSGRSGSTGRTPRIIELEQYGTGPSVSTGQAVGEQIAAEQARVRAAEHDSQGGALQTQGSVRRTP